MSAILPATPFGLRALRVPGPTPVMEPGSEHVTAWCRARSKAVSLCSSRALLIRSLDNLTVTILPLPFSLVRSNFPQLNVEAAIYAAKWRLPAFCTPIS
jgi:hypothetical protein